MYTFLFHVESICSTLWRKYFCCFILLTVLTSALKRFWMLDFNLWLSFLHTVILLLLQEKMFRILIFTTVYVSKIKCVMIHNIFYNKISWIRWFCVNSPWCLNVEKFPSPLALWTWQLLFHPIKESCTALSFPVGITGFVGVTSRDAHRAMFPSPRQENFYSQRESSRSVSSHPEWEQCFRSILSK